MRHVAGNGPLEKPEHIYRKTSDPLARRRVQAEVVEAHRGHVKALVRRTVPRPHWEEGQQVGALGVLVALKKYDPTPRPGYGEEPPAFWLFARAIVLWELERWSAAQFFCRRRSQNRKRDEKNDPGGVLREAGRRPVSMDDPGLVFASQDLTPEEAYAALELSDRLNAFISTLSKKEKALLLANRRGDGVEKGNNTRSRRYLSLVKDAVAWMTGKDDDNRRAPDSAPAAGTAAK